MDRKTERILVATFWLCLLVVAVNVATAVVNWKAYYSRANLFAQVEQLQQRIVEIEAAEKLQDMRQCKRLKCQQ